MMTEKRDTPRMPVILDAILNYRATAVMCTVRDISLGGAYVEAQPEDLPYSGDIELGITVNNNNGPSKYYRLPGRICRVTNSGAGISFQSDRQDAYFSLVDLVYR
jgi:hypothetical protein